MSFFNLAYLIVALAAIIDLATCRSEPEPSAPDETIPVDTASADEATGAVTASGGEHERGEHEGGEHEGGGVEGGGRPSDSAGAPLSSEDLDGDPVELRARDRREQAAQRGEPIVPPVGGRLNFARLKPQIRAHQLQLELNEWRDRSKARERPGGEHGSIRPP